MRIGTVREIKTLEFRVGITPEGVAELTHHGHEVFVESGAGLGIGLGDDAYRSAGATVLPDARSVFDKSEMIVKVKEPQATEIAMLRPDHTLFTYLHLAADRDQTLGLMKSGATAIAYETITDNYGRLPLLAPMSQVAGRMATMVASQYMMKAFALGMRADVTIFDISAERLAAVDAQFGGAVKGVHSSKKVLQDYLPVADAIIGCVLVTGAAAPKLIRREDLKKMKPGAVLVDVAIDQGGCFETSKPTTHEHPTFVVDGIIHYCVANMPGAAPLTSTYALTAVTLPFVLRMAEKGVAAALAADPHLKNGLNVQAGKITHPAVQAVMEAA
jgi:alanine dehydrogenase